MWGWMVLFLVGNFFGSSLAFLLPSTRQKHHNHHYHHHHRHHQYHGRKQPSAHQPTTQPSISTTATPVGASHLRLESGAYNIPHPRKMNGKVVCLHGRSQGNMMMMVLPSSAEEV